MLKAANCWGLALVAFALGLGGHALGAEAGETVAMVHVEVAAGRLTLVAREAPLDEVLRQIAGAAGVEITIRGSLTTRVTRSMEGVPLDEAIEELTRGYSVGFVYGGLGEPRSLQEVWLIESGLEVEGGPDVQPATPDRPSRLSAVRALGSRGDAAAAAELARIVTQDPDPIVRHQAIGALEAFRGEAAAEALTAAVQDDEVAVRTRAVYALRRVAGERAVPALAGVLLGDPSPAVRQAAARALGLLGGEQALAVLQHATLDPDESVRHEVAQVLAGLKRKLSVAR
ncbi:MAG: HEAT repeat domain-containing protein [Candidatus Rokubacteria bacterium]|nr:HEAT repeat domain-containing protein [Candidatus Rokubacteria bacterium]